MTIEHSEDLENRKKRLIFRSGHRGTKEMDLIMASFAQKHIAAFGVEELNEYERILESPDPDLYNWITGKTQAPANMDGAVFKRLLAHQFVE